MFGSVGYGLTMSRALVLNITCEPLAVVSDRRAAILVLYGRAIAVHGSGKPLRSTSVEIELPSVVRLSRYIKIPHQRATAVTRRAVFIRDRFQCQYCGRKAESIDHVRPRSRGGKHEWENVVAACRACNTRKRDRLPSEIRMRPMNVPLEPSRHGWVRLSVATVPTEWDEYLSSAPLVESA